MPVHLVQKVRNQQPRLPVRVNRNAPLSKHLVSAGLFLDGALYDACTGKAYKAPTSQTVRAANLTGSTGTGAEDYYPVPAECFKAHKDFTLFFLYRYAGGAAGESTRLLFKNPNHRVDYGDSLELSGPDYDNFLRFYITNSGGYSGHDGVAAPHPSVKLGEVAPYMYAHPGGASGTIYVPGASYSVTQAGTVIAPDIVGILGVYAHRSYNHNFGYLLFDKVLGEAEYKSLSANLWQNFEPETIPLFFSTVTAQYARPTSDVSAGTWTASSGADLYAMLDETTANDSDYIVTTGASTCEVSLGYLNDPGVNTGHVVRYRIAADSGGIIVRLRNNGSTIASWTHAPAPTSLTTYEQTLTGSEADAANYAFPFSYQFEATA